MQEITKEIQMHFGNAMNLNSLITMLLKIVLNPKVDVRIYPGLCDCNG